MSDDNEKILTLEMGMAIDEVVRLKRRRDAILQEMEKKRRIIDSEYENQYMNALRKRLDQRIKSLSKEADDAAKEVEKIKECLEEKEATLKKKTDAKQGLKLYACGLNTGHTWEQIYNGPKTRVQCTNCSVLLRYWPGIRDTYRSEYPTFDDVIETWEPMPNDDDDDDDTHQ